MRNTLLVEAHHQIPCALGRREERRRVRPIDAKEIILILDACRSAASVDQDGLKPGPLGVPGFGQLAYDKKMRILAASGRASDAIESGDLKNGLLTYVQGFVGKGRITAAAVTPITFPARAGSSVPATGMIIGGFSNGAHSTQGLIDESDGEIAKQFSAFFFIEGGGHLKHYELLKGKPFLMVSSQTGSKRRAKEICDQAAAAGALITFIFEDAGGHTIPMRRLLPCAPGSSGRRWTGRKSRHQDISISKKPSGVTTVRSCGPRSTVVVGLSTIAGPAMS
jgi:hypothetical protein